MKDIKGLFLMLGGVVLFIIIVGLITKTNRGETTILSPYLHSINTKPTPIPAGLSNLKEIMIGKTSFMVNIANTSATRQKGLGGVVAMPDNEGMLFIFDSKKLSPQMARFWMKDMLIPLDFIWITDDRVVEITPNVAAPAPNASDRDLQIYEPHEVIDYVLEINAGVAAKNNIKVGDNFILK